MMAQRKATGESRRTTLHVLHVLRRKKQILHLCAQKAYECERGAPEEALNEALDCGWFPEDAPQRLTTPSLDAEARMRWQQPSRRPCNDRMSQQCVPSDGRVDETESWPCVDEACLQKTSSVNGSYVWCSSIHTWWRARRPEVHMQFAPPERLERERWRDFHPLVSFCNSRLLSAHLFFCSPVSGIKIATSIVNLAYIFRWGGFE